MSEGFFLFQSQALAFWLVTLLYARIPKPLKYSSQHLPTERDSAVVKHQPQPLPHSPDLSRGRISRAVRPCECSAESRH